jgi:hypothetical protein
MGLRILGAAVDPAADGRLRAGRLAGRPLPWIVGKFWSWTGSGSDLHRVTTRDELLDNLMLYWPPGTGASSARLYWETHRLSGLPYGAAAPVSAVGGAPVPEHPVLERARQGRPLRGVRAAGVVRRRGPVILPAGPLMVTRTR